MWLVCQLTAGFRNKKLIILVDRQTLTNCLYLLQIRGLTSAQLKLAFFSNHFKSLSWLSRYTRINVKKHFSGLFLDFNFNLYVKIELFYPQNQNQNSPFLLLLIYYIAE